MAAAEHQDVEAAVAAEAVSAVGDRPEVGAEAAGAVEDAAASAAVAEAAAGELFYFWDISLLAHAILFEQRSECLVSDIFKLIISFHITHETHLVSCFSNGTAPRHLLVLLMSSGIVAAVEAEAAVSAADGAVVAEAAEVVEAAMAAAAAE